MLSEKIVTYCKNKGWWSDDIAQPYLDVILDLGIDPSSACGQFYLHAEDGPSFLSRQRELYHICWFSINSQYKLDIKRTQERLHMPDDYLPLDSFEAGDGFFYNRSSGEVAAVKTGKQLHDFLLGDMQPQWKNFNDFLEWYFELN